MDLRMNLNELMELQYMDWLTTLEKMAQVLFTSGINI